MGRKRKQIRYWDTDQDEALKEYLATDDPELKNKIFEEKLYMPLYKLAEVWTNKNCRYAQFQEFHSKLMTHLLHNIIPTVDYNKRPSAFALLTLAARHFSINENNRNYANHIRFVPDCDSTSKDEESTSLVDRIAYMHSMDGIDMFPPDFDWDTFRQKMISRIDKSTVTDYLKCRSNGGRNTALIRIRKALHTLGVRFNDGEDAKYARKNPKRIMKPALKAMKWFRPMAMEILKEMDPERFGD